MPSQPSKRELFEELIDEVRRSQTATARFDQAVAAAVGINLTDLSCVDVLQREGPMTAGRLAAETGLSSGAMTTALDRLERAGFARRLRDVADRRRVLVEVTDRVSELHPFYREHVVHSERLYHRYTTEQLQLLLRFVRESRQLNEREAARVEEQNRQR